MKKLLCLLLVLLSLSACAEAAPTKVMLSCDMGWMNDDALALSMLLQLESRGEVEILGIVLSGGNNFITAKHTDDYGIMDGSSQYTSDLLARFGREDIPVFLGTDYPLGFTADNIDTLDMIHRTYTAADGTVSDRVILIDGWGALWCFDDFDGELSDSDAAMDFIIEQVNTYPGEVTLISIGANTDIARAVQKDATIAEKTAALYIMGGAFADDTAEAAGANTSNFAEYNVFYDPEALAVVLRAGFNNVVITPATCMVDIPADLLETLTDAAGDMPNALIQAWIESYSDYLQDYPYWDPMTVYALMSPDKITKSVSGYVTVNVDPADERYGETVFYTDAEYQALDSDAQADCGAATVVYAIDGFWNYAIPLLAE